MNYGLGNFSVLLKFTINLLALSLKEIVLLIN